MLAGSKTAPQGALRPLSGGLRSTSGTIKAAIISKLFMAEAVKNISAQAKRVFFPPGDESLFDDVTVMFFSDRLVYKRSGDYCGDRTESMKTHKFADAHH